MNDAAMPPEGAAAPRPTPRRPLLQAARRIPFTSALIATVLVVTASNGLWGHPLGADQLARWGFGLQDLVRGDLWRLLSAPSLILRPYMALTISAILLFFVGTAEMVLRTRRTLVTFVVCHAAGYIGAITLLDWLGRLGNEHAAMLAAQRDVGASNGAFGAAGALVIFLPRSFRTTGLLVFPAYLLGAIVVENQLWDVQHTIAFAVGALLGLWFRRRDESDRPGLPPSVTVLHRQRPRLMAWMVGGMGLVNVLAPLLLPHHSGFARLEALLPLGNAQAPRSLLLFSGLILLQLAAGLARGQRNAWWGAFLVMLLTLYAHIEMGITKLEALFALLFLVLLAAWKEDFRAPGRVTTVRAAVRSGVVLVVAAPVAVWLAILALHSQYSDWPGAGAAAADVLRRLLYLAPGALVPASRQSDWILDVTPILFWVVVLAAVVRLLRAARMHPAPVGERERARGLVLEHGRTGTAYMGTAAGNMLHFSEDGQAFLPYRVAGNVAVALGDPTGPDAGREAALRGFLALCAERGWSPAVLAATEGERALYRSCGLKLLQIGEDAILPLQGVEFKGKAWQNVRTALNRAKKLGMTFVLVEGGRLDPALEAQVFEISRGWEDTQALPPLEFTLGRTEDVRDPNVEVALAVDADGRVHGFVDWLPEPAVKGRVIDLMRRRDDAMSGTMEYLIAMSMLAFQQRGEAFVSLAAAPLADLDRTDSAALVPRVMGAIARRFDTYYSFQSLFDFKDRFQPRWEPVHLAYLDAADLPGIALAIVRVHLPHLGWTDTVRLLGSALAERLRPEPARAGERPAPPAAPAGTDA
ncbi:MAG TPA: DUF2156 domain-containing protein [Candidatus Krumholzibacteria bacterium]|nr:DUF2156 domain-containing protein [Candidatus Krumholzibacteria bacterium]